MIKFVIPSYQRPTILKDKTLMFLDKQGIPKESIYIIVRTDDKYYTDYYNLLETGINLVPTSVKGIGKTHNFITSFFNEDELICELDDDLELVINKDRVEVDDFLQILMDMKTKMIEKEINYAGFYQCTNPKFMSGNKEYTTDLRYMLGLMRLRFIKKDIIILTDFAEDFEHCLRYFVRDGKILKNNWIAGKTKNYAIGGCNGAGRDFETERIDKEILFNEFPNLCRIFKRKNGRWDLRLKEYKIN